VASDLVNDWVDGVARDPQFAHVVDQAPPRHAIKARQRDILANVAGQDQAQLLAVLGDESKTGIDRCRR
jgi:hypothetical protein